MEKQILETMADKLGLVVGPHGGKIMPELCAAIEGLIKSAEHEGGRNVRGFNLGCKSETYDKFPHATVDRITNNQIDLSLEVVDCRKLDLSYFRKSPHVFLSHETDNWPIGFSHWIKHYNPETGSGDQTKATEVRSGTQFYSRPPTYPSVMDWVPDTIWHMQTENNKIGRSIGFISSGTRLPTNKEVEANPALSKCKIHKESFLTEYSCVWQPCNPDAVTLEIAKSLTQMGEWTWPALQLDQATINKIKDITDAEAWEEVADETYLWHFAKEWEAASEPQPIPETPIEGISWDEIAKDFVNKIKRA